MSNDDLILEKLDTIIDLLRSFTSGGRPMAAAVPDARTMAYLLLVTNGIAASLNTSESTVEDVLKGSIYLSENILRQLDTYRSNVEPTEILRNLLEDIDSGQSRLP